MKFTLPLLFLAALPTILAIPTDYGNYGSYGSYPGAPVPSPAPAPVSGYGSYPKPAGGYGSYPAPKGGYGSYKRGIEDLVRRVWG